MIETKIDKLYQKMVVAAKQLKLLQDPEAKIALINYMENLFDSLMDIDTIVEDIDFFEDCYEEYHYFCKRMKTYDKKYLKSYLRQKDFHQKYLDHILIEIEECLPEKVDLTGEEVAFSAKDFWDIFYQFLKEIKLEELFNSFYHNGSIYSIHRDSQKDALGYTIYNPILKDSDLFIQNFRYDLFHMNILAHEFGHGYDFARYDGSITDYNRYFYLSSMTEVLSTLMERLLYRFLLKNHIETEIVKEKYCDFEFQNYDLVLSAYIYSLLNDPLIMSIHSQQMDMNKILKVIKEEFDDEEKVKIFLEKFQQYEIGEVYSYAYGDILSLFLCEAVEQDGFYTPVMKEFLRQRNEKFPKEFMKKYDFSPKNYGRQYQKEWKLIQKG